MLFLPFFCGFWSPRCIIGVMQVRDFSTATEAMLLEFCFGKDMRSKKWDSYIIITLFVDCSGNYLCIFVRLGRHATPHNTPRISIFDFGLVTNGLQQSAGSAVQSDDVL